MPRFSESLFESIRNFGRMSPTEGRRRALEQPTQYQQMGTTDPLARSLGKMFGGLGVDTSYMQTGEERAQAAMQKAGEQEFASPEARMIAMLEAQMPTLRPTAQMQAMDQIRQLRDIERQRAAAEAEKKAETAVAERQETVERGKQNLVRMASDPEFDFANPKQKAGYLSMARAYGVEPKEALELYDSLKPEAKKAVGSRAAPTKFTIDVPGRGNVEYAVYRDEETGEVIQKEIGLAEAKPIEEKGRGEITRQAEAQFAELSKTATDASYALTRNRQLVDDLLANPEKATGIFSSIRTGILDAAGLRDAEEIAKTNFLRVRNSNIVNDLPPGVASDTDVRIFSAGFPSETASSTEILAYLQAEQRILGAQQDMARLADQHLTQQAEQGLKATMVGFETKKQEYGATYSKMMKDMQAELAAGADSTVTEQKYKRYMQEIFGFVPAYHR
jgi:hypothetical protein